MLSDVRRPASSSTSGRGSSSKDHLASERADLEVSADGSRKAFVKGVIVGIVNVQKTCQLIPIHDEEVVANGLGGGHRGPTRLSFPTANKPEHPISLIDGTPRDTLGTEHDRTHCRRQRADRGLFRLAAEGSCELIGCLLALNDLRTEVLDDLVPVGVLGIEPT